VLGPVLGFEYKKGVDILATVRQRATNITEASEHQQYQEILRELRLFILEKAKLRGNLINV